MAITDTIEINAGPAIAELNAFADAAERADAAFAKLGKGGAGGLGADRLAASMNAAADAIERAGQRAAAAMGRLSTASRSATGGVDALGASADKAGAGLDRAAAGADAAAAASDRLAAGADAGAVALDRQAVAGKRTNEGFLSKHKELLLGTAVVMGYAVDKAMKFNATMTMLNTQANVPKKWLPELSKGVLTLAGQVGIGPNSLADSLYHVASNMASMPGVSPVKMLEATKVAAEGAAVGHSNLVDTTTALTSVLASGIPGAKNYSQAMGFLNATVGSGEMHMQDLAEAFGTGVVPVVKGYGLTLKDVGASLATFGDLNIRGAKAGTDLRMAVQSLAVPAKAGKTQLEAWGRSADSLAKDMQQGGLIKALDDLNHMFKQHGITAKTEGGVITDMFGKKAGAGLSLLLEDMTRLHSKYPVLQQDANNFGKAWQATQDTAQQKLKQVEAGAQALAITGGNVLMPAASALLGGLNKTFDWIQGNAFASKGVALGAGALVTGGLAKGLFSGVGAGLSGLGSIGKLLKIPGADKLAGIGQGAGLSGAAGELSGAAARLSAAAGELSGSAGKLDTAGAAGGAGKGGASGLSAALGPVGLGAMLGAALRAAGDSLSPRGTAAGRVNAALQSQAGRPGPAQQLHPYILGGLEAKAATSGFGLEVGKLISRGLSFGSQLFSAPFHAIFGGGRPAPAPAPVSSPDRMLGFGGHPGTIKMPPPDLSAITAAKGKAQSAAAAIVQGMTAALGKPVKAKAPDISAYRSAVGPAKADGAQISAGLAAGIEAGKGAAVAAAADVANAVAAAMAHAAVVRSPSEKTKKTGKGLADGLVVGLEGGKAAVDAVAAALGKNAAKAADLASIDASAKKLLGEVPKGDTGLVRMLKSDNRQLDRLANQRARLEAEIKEAGQVAQNAISGASIMSAIGYTPAMSAAGGPQSAQGLIGGMQDQAADLKAFAGQVKQLAKMGLNATTLSQIVQAGPSQGLPVAQGITSGGKGAVSQLNQVEAQILASSKQLGNTAAPSMYAAGQAAGQGLAAGIKSQLGAVEGAIKKLAQAMVTAVKKDLKSHSPSLVFAEIGLGIPQGLAQGVDAGGGIAEASVRRLGARAAAAWPGGRGGGGQVSHVTNVYVQGHVMTEHDLVSMIQEHVVTRATNNWQAGWRPLGRAA